MVAPVFWIGSVVWGDAEFLVREFARVRHVPVTLKIADIWRIHKNNDLREYVPNDNTCGT